MRSSRTLFTLALLAAAGAACGPTPQRTAIPVAAPYGANQVPYGAWRVTSYRFVGVSGMSRREADGWIGREARFSRTTAGFDPDVCESPSYVSSTVSVADFAADFRVRPSDLGIAGANVQVIDVRCHDAWVAPGNRLLLLGPERLVMVWDGVFFDLVRNREQEREPGP